MNINTVRRIRTYDDLEPLFGSADEDVISKYTFKYNRHGPWARFISRKASGTTMTRTFHLRIRKSIAGPFLRKVRLSTSNRWYMPDELAERWPTLYRLLGDQDGLKHLHDHWCFTNRDTARFINNMPYYRGPDSNGLEVVVKLKVTMPREELYRLKDRPQIGIAFGATVEGMDEETEVVEVWFPCSQKEIWNALAEVESQAQELWDATHGCPGCTPPGEAYNPGHTPVNPDCIRCNGEGRIL